MGVHYLNYNGSSYRYVKGRTWCDLCKVYISWESWAQHIHGRDSKKRTTHQINAEVVYLIVCQGYLFVTFACSCVLRCRAGS